MKRAAVLAGIASMMVSGCVMNGNKSSAPPGGTQATMAGQPQGYPAYPGPNTYPGPAPGTYPSQPNGAGGVAYPTYQQLPQVPVPPNDGSWSLLEQQQWASLAKDFQHFLDNVNNRCESRIDGVFVFASFRGRFTNRPDRPLDDDTRDHAMAPFLALDDLCGENPTLSKPAVRAKIRRIDVYWGPPTMGTSTLYVGNGVVAVTINPADGVRQSYYKQFILSEVRRRL